MKEQITQIIARHLNAESSAWLQQTSGQLTSASALQKAFGLMPRKTGKNPVVLTEAEVHDNSFRQFEGWTIDRVCRVYLLMQFNEADESSYHRAVDQLFLAADLNELVALYSALPVLKYAESWTGRCSEGIRSNVGTVLEAIMYQNPYPARYLGQAAWNQMVLKAFFTDKNLDLITGLRERNNRDLALTLLDYVHERRAAGRTVNPIIWRLIGEFAGAEFMGDFIQVLAGTDQEARQQLSRALVSLSICPQNN